MRIEKEEVTFNDRLTFLKLPKVFVGTFRNGDTTPSVKDVNIWKSPSGATTVTNFDDGAEGQTIMILGNGNLTVTHGTYIKNNSGAPKVLAANKVYTFVLIEEPAGTFIWYEEA